MSADGDASASTLGEHVDEESIVRSLSDAINVSA
jgi:hypothetical protein